MPKEVKLKSIPIDLLQPAGWNPNVEDVATFNELVNSIEQDGFLEPLLVAPNDDETYMIIAGEHRWKAARQVGLTEVPAVIAPDWELDKRKAETVRMNVVRGKLNPAKFAELYLGLERKYGRLAAMKMVGFSAKEKALHALIKQVQGSAPRLIKDGLERRRDRIRTVEDLAAVVQSLYAQYGTTLEHNYMILAYGGRTHLLIRMTKPTVALLQTVLDKMHAASRDANDLLQVALEQAAVRFDRILPDRDSVGEATDNGG